MVGQQLSEVFTCNMGVRQVENLSPLLFAFYVNDLQEKAIKYNCNYLNFNDDPVNTYLRLLVIMYPDDNVILCDCEQNKKVALISLHRYCLVEIKGKL